MEGPDFRRLNQQDGDRSSATSFGPFLTGRQENSHGNSEEKLEKLLA